MNAWDLYEERMGVRGEIQQEAFKNRELRRIHSFLPNNPSYTEVLIDGKRQKVSIINSDNLNEKMIYSVPGEDIRNGALVYWMENYWLVIERDANTTLYTKCKLLQCNYLLRWISEDSVIHEQWCAVEDGTKLEIVSIQRNLCALNLSNCWDKEYLVLNLKPTKLQHRNEICSSANAAKAEKISWMAYAEIKALSLKYDNVLSAARIGNQQPIPEQGRVQRPELMLVGLQVFGSSKR